MSVKAITGKYYELVIKLYKNINSDQIKWIKAMNAEFYTAEISQKFKLRIYKSVGNLATRYLFRMYDNGGIMIFEINTEKNGQDRVVINGESMVINDILEEIYEWACAYSSDIIEKIETVSEMLDDLTAAKQKQTG
jgi:hypothetical protein